MRVSNTPRRNKNRGHGSRRGNNVSNNNFEANGKDIKIKGNAIQVHEKYQALARDAISAGDIIKAEYYYQHAEHYHRVHKTSLSVINDKNLKKQKDYNSKKDGENIIEIEKNAKVTELKNENIKSQENTELK